MVCSTPLNPSAAGPSTGRPRRHSIVTITPRPYTNAPDEREIPWICVFCLLIPRNPIVLGCAHLICADHLVAYHPDHSHERQYLGRPGYFEGVWHGGSDVGDTSIDLGTQAVPNPLPASPSPAAPPEVVVDHPGAQSALQSAPQFADDPLPASPPSTAPVEVANELPPPDTSYPTTVVSLNDSPNLLPHEGSPLAPAQDPTLLDVDHHANQSFDSSSDVSGDYVSALSTPVPAPLAATLFWPEATNSPIPMDLDSPIITDSWSPVTPAGPPPDLASPLPQAPLPPPYFGAHSDSNDSSPAAQPFGLQDLEAGITSLDLNLVTGVATITVDLNAALPPPSLPPSYPGSPAHHPAAVSMLQPSVSALQPSVSIVPANALGGAPVSAATFPPPPPPPVLPPPPPPPPPPMALPPPPAPPVTHPPPASAAPLATPLHPPLQAQLQAAAAPHPPSPSYSAVTWDVDEEELAERAGMIEALHAVNMADGNDMSGNQIYPELAALANAMDSN